MDNPFVDAAIEMNAKADFGRTLDNELTKLSYVKWLPHLHLDPKPPIAEDTPELMKARQVYDHFMKLNPETPFDAFLAFLDDLPEIPTGQSKVDQVVQAIRLGKLGKSVFKPKEKPKVITKTRTIYRKVYVRPKPKTNLVYVPLMGGEYL